MGTLNKHGSAGCLGRLKGRLMKNRKVQLPSFAPHVEFKFESQRSVMSNLCNTPRKNELHLTSGPVKGAATKGRSPLVDHHIYTPATLYGNWNTNHRLNVDIGTAKAGECSIRHRIVKTQENTETCSHDAQKPTYTIDTSCLKQKNDMSSTKIIQNVEICNKIYTEFSTVCT